MTRLRFETGRLTVAEWHAQTGGAGDGRLLAQVVTRFLTPLVTEHLPASWHGPYSEERALKWIQGRDREGTQLLARSRASGEPVGLLILHAPTGPNLREVRLGYLIAESKWGRGFATELLGGFVDWARSSAFESIVAGVGVTNLPSIRVLEKCGFTRLDGDAASGSEAFFTISV